MLKMKYRIGYIVLLLSAVPIKRAACCQSNIPARFPSLASNRTEPLAGGQAKQGREGMGFIKGRTFAMGADNKQAVADEYPKRPVSVGGADKHRQVGGIEQVCFHFFKLNFSVGY